MLLSCSSHGAAQSGCTAGCFTSIVLKHYKAQSTVSCNYPGAQHTLAKQCASCPQILKVPLSTMALVARWLLRSGACWHTWHSAAGHSTVQVWQGMAQHKYGRAWLSTSVAQYKYDRPWHSTSMTRHGTAQVWQDMAQHNYGRTWRSTSVAGHGTAQVWQDMERHKYGRA
jgi:hypothetical protein